ncbi:hypothetical protein SAMN05216352_103120 [Alteribacillus bidgolensis]|uniref:Uncharacterized protein n=1 Tax=Alteribacillus bidgolensis TaxID=930129 RepID=A0A1G8FWN1_9BACI|nr:hypothetical protein SAMN05216352_103120 [Alteribacillus bidgolensis]
MKQFCVGILLFNDVDGLDFAGPYEVFNLSTYKDDVKKLFMKQLGREEKSFLVNTVSEKGECVRVHNGLIVQYSQISVLKILSYLKTQSYRT